MSAWYQGTHVNNTPANMLALNRWQVINNYHTNATITLKKYRKFVTSYCIHLVRFKLLHLIWWMYSFILLLIRAYEYDFSLCQVRHDMTSFIIIIKNIWLYKNFPVWIKLKTWDIFDCTISIHFLGLWHCADIIYLLSSQILWLRSYPQDLTQCR